MKLLQEAPIYLIQKRTDRNNQNIHDLNPFNLFFKRSPNSDKYFSYAHLSPLILSPYYWVEPSESR